MYTEIFAERWLWLIGSLSIALLFSWARWVIHRINPPWATRLGQWSGLPWIYQGLRLLYMVGIPTLALLWRGALTERGLGLQPLPGNTSAALSSATLADWARDIGWAISIGVGAWIILLIGDYRVKRIVGTTTERQRTLSTALREALYHQIHWAFYREPFVLLWGMPTGTWAGLLPLTFETLSNPARWAELNAPDTARALLIRAALAVVSVLIYLQTQNLWLALLVDATLGWALGHTET